MIHQLLVAYSDPLRVVDGAFFHLVDRLERGAGLTGAVDSKSGILSFWLKPNLMLTTKEILVSTQTAGGFEIRSFESSNLATLYIDGYNTANTKILAMTSGSSFSAIGGPWRHVMFSWNLATGATHGYMNDVSSLVTVTATNDTIDYTVANWAVGADIGGGGELSASLAELYFAPNQYLDLSVEANRRKFISAGLKPVYLGADGSLPTSTVPLVYLHLYDGEAVASFATNRGTGGDFTITGTLDTASTSPSD